MKQRFKNLWLLHKRHSSPWYQRNGLKQLTLSESNPSVVKTKVRRRVSLLPVILKCGMIQSQVRSFKIFRKLANSVRRRFCDLGVKKLKKGLFKIMSLFNRDAKIIYNSVKQLELPQDQLFIHDDELCPCGSGNFFRIVARINQILSQLNHQSQRKFF